ncbi:hypothetical protein [Olleya aquimaris]|uniref:Uncharacterized protein n=1 Tax=Olleya aquimaris TaxID=639310 RepID=A0A327RBQ7_9FLAO|nr:hypothetical protein [Olleya aquimaris]RAJ13024.1 hypothetical protein LY08_02306 [Olleya aquimaris]
MGLFRGILAIGILGSGVYFAFKTFMSVYTKTNSALLSVLAGASVGILGIGLAAFAFSSSNQSDPWEDADVVEEEDKQPE